ncbi:hypothetical protein GCM10029964_037900 [Kibdelosporangium lantanae]
MTSGSDRDDKRGRVLGMDMYTPRPSAVEASAKPVTRARRRKRPPAVVPVVRVPHGPPPPRPPTPPAGPAKTIAGGIALGLVGLCTTLVALTSHGENEDAFNRGQLATGTIVELHPFTGHNDPWIAVDYTTAAGEHMTHVEDRDYLWQPTPVVGQQVRIQYDPENPGDDLHDPRVPPDLWEDTIWSSIVAMLTLGSLAGLLNRRRLDNRRYAADVERYVEAQAKRAAARSRRVTGNTE